MTTFDMPAPADVRSAAQALDGVAIRTPLLRSARLSRITGSEVFIKLESLQHTGAFKFRGAYNCLSRLKPDDCPDGVLAYSTGNHGQAIATVARLLGLRAKVVMPEDAPAVKIEKARKQGAEIVLYNRTRESREDIARRISDTGRYTTVPPGDHPHVIAGQGTVAFEALAEFGEDRIDTIIVPCGGGGLAAGTCLARDALASHADVWVAEPSAFDDTRRSLASGRRETNAPGVTSICDALLAPTPAELPFAINKIGVARAISATDEQVMAAMKLLYEEFRVAVEPGGAVAVAAVMREPSLLPKKGHVIIVASGGNVDADLFAAAISQAV
ncbi:threonine ammonia-lyase [Bordetella genomosp. 10]|nr:threonine/serine dehydratase [Bordetella genomosp. 10]